MNVAIRDSATLRAIPVLSLVQYLRADGWLPTPLGPHATLWTSAHDGRPLEVLVPNSNDVADYPFRMADALDALSLKRDKSQAVVLAELLSADADVIRISARGDAFADGTAPIAVGVRLVAAAEEALLAAACAALNTRAVYPSRKPPAATEYMKRVRLGQTERGSFVLSVLSPVAPALLGQVPLFELAGDPYERRVVLMLARGLEATKAAILAAAATGSSDPFIRAVERGVNANLCDSIAQLLDADVIRGVDVRFSWSSARPTNGFEGGTSFEAGEAPILREASRVFREREPQPEYALTGPVVGLQRAEGADDGVATIAAIVGGPVRKVLVELQRAEYEVAIQAHESRTVVTVEGELVKAGRQYSLRNPHGLAVTATED